MRDEKRQERHQEISAAAYALMAERGYDGTSMLNIAKAAKASNETLYRWYGDKRGLFEVMVRDNAALVSEVLTQAVEDGADPLMTLEVVAPVLLAMLLGDRAIHLNRAAAADPSGELGAAISAGGRAVVTPLFARIMGEIETQSGIPPEELALIFLSLLIGDQQIKRVTGVIPAPSDAQIAARVDFAMSIFKAML